MSQSEIHSSEQSNLAATTPERIFAAMMAYQTAEALHGAIELDLFTALAEGATTVPALAARCQASERGIRILCDYLTITGLLTKDGATYALTSDSAAFLNKHSPAYMGSATTFLNSDYLRNGFRNVAENVRRGTTLLGGEGSMDPDHPMWVDFARGMMPLMFPAAQEIAALLGPMNPCRVLDIAAGHGIFGIALAQANPQAEVSAVDWANVLTVAQENAQRFGVADRYRTLAGSAFEVDFGSGYDIVLFTNFFHHFDPPTCESLMRKAHAALNEGGRAVTLEFVPNEDRITPPPQASFSLVMLATTPSGDAYTFAEFEQMFRNAGYARSELHELTVSPERLIVSYK
ncbi:MAG TPA: class I SAM-dependent methyltransferase [Blastocatellia bacterium]|nr:class I SAM-dependent methyltransferase [Blastocatellia bacterium]